LRPTTKNILSALTLFLAVWLGVNYFLPLLFPFLMGLILALLAEPGVRFLTGRLHLPRGVAAGISVTAVFGALALLILLAAAFLIRELGLLTGILPDLTQTAQSGLASLRGWMYQLAAGTPGGIRPLLEQNVEALFSGGSALLDKVFGYVLGLAGGILRHVPDSALSLGTGVISGFMISARLPRISRWLREQISKERLQKLLHTLTRLKKTLLAWITAQLKLAGVTLGILLAGFLVLRIPYGPVWAVAVSLVDAFPVLGTGTVLLPWALVCWLQADRARALGLLGIYGIISLTRSVLEPKLVGRQLGLDPLVTLFALYAGYKLWGVGGMILAPLVAVTAVQLAGTRQQKE